MSQKFVFHEQEAFLHKLRQLVDSGVNKKDLEIYTPYPVHEAEQLLQYKTSPMRFFTLLGALSGLFFGFWLTIWTSLDWPILRGGKPIVSIPAFIILAFEVTILFGGVISFIGFLILSKFPNFKNINKPVDYGNQFVIEMVSEEK
jgi:hypothetical protein